MDDKKAVSCHTQLCRVSRPKVFGSRQRMSIGGISGGPHGIAGERRGVNVSLTAADGVTPVKREREAMQDLATKGGLPIEPLST